MYILKISRFYYACILICMYIENVDSFIKMCNSFKFIGFFLVKTVLVTKVQTGNNIQNGITINNFYYLLNFELFCILQGWFEKCKLYTLSDFLQNDIANWLIADFENLKYHIFFFVEQPILGGITGLIKEQCFNN